MQPLFHCSILHSLQTPKGYLYNCRCLFRRIKNYNNHFCLFLILRLGSISNWAITILWQAYLQLKLNKLLQFWYRRMLEQSLGKEQNRPQLTVLIHTINLPPGQIYHVRNKDKVNRTAHWFDHLRINMCRCNLDPSPYCIGRLPPPDRGSRPVLLPHGST